WPSVPCLDPREEVVVLAVTEVRHEKVVATAGDRGIDQFLVRDTLPAARRALRPCGRLAATNHHDQSVDLPPLEAVDRGQLDRPRVHPEVELPGLPHRLDRLF